ncbi:MAG: hemerythrin domain-containing protein, partial [Myxococcota bacterium]
MTGLGGWRERHADLDRALTQARRLAPERDRARFLAGWDPFVAALRHHLRCEEDALLPAFDQWADDAAPNHHPRVVRRDHGLILD